MTSESKPGFNHNQQQSSSISFKSSNSNGELISIGNYYNNPVAARDLSADDGAVLGNQFFSSAAAQNNSLGSSYGLLLDLVPGLKHDAGLAVEWTVEEQYKLEDGLAKYANEPKIMQYIKIAASFPNKTVRDIALRCRWMMRKQRKHDDHNLGKKVKDRKDKFESLMKNNTHGDLSVSMPAFFTTPNYHQQNGSMLSGASSFPAKHLLEENNRAFGQISSNLSSLKLEENIGLLFRTRNNIATILNEMNRVPGIMSRMPPLPVLLNEEELASTIFPHSSQTLMFGSSSVRPLKQEPRC